MSEHAWVDEHVAAYVAGGLTAQEAERLEAHVATCSECEDAVTATRELDRELNRLFVDVRPGPELEDAVVNRMRAEGASPAPTKKPIFSRWSARFAATAAALVFVGAFGAFASLIAKDGLPMPGGAKVKNPYPRDVAERARIWSEPDETPSSGDPKTPKKRILFEPGKDIMSLPISAARAAGGFVGPGARVDIVGSVVEGGKRRVFTVLTDVDVLAVNGEQDLTKQTTFPDMSMVSFPVTPDEAKLITLANQRNANLELVLRHPDAPLRHPTPEAREKARKETLTLLKNLGNAEAGTGATMTYLSDPSGYDPYPQTLPMPAGPVAPPVTPVAPPVTPVVPTTVPSLGRPEDPVKSSPVTPVAPATVAAPPSDPKAKPKIIPAADPAKESDVAEEPKKKKEEPSFDPAPEPSKRIVIRSGNMEFEVPSFDAATAAITKSVLGLKGAFVATVNSEKLPNGKVRGSITIRTPPEHLDGLVLELRKELGKDGELKGVNISSQDVTKQYTDLESRLRGARTMETRLLQIIKEGKGEIKQLLEAERELGVWRTKIEETEGELRYYANLAALSTLTISLAEKEIRAAATVTENERVQAGVEVDDVDKVYQQLMAAVIEAKGRITKSEVKQLAAGQFNATLNFDVPPDAAGPIRDRLKQLGRVARLEIDRVQRPEGGTLPTDAKLTRGDTVFNVQLYNLANIAARETVTLQIAVSEVPAAFQTLREVVGKTTSRVFTAKFDEQDKQNITAQLDFEIRRTDEGTVRTALGAAGETFSRQLTRAPESDNVTDSKVLYRITVISMGRLRPRETATLSVAVVDVPAAYQSLRETIAKAHGRMLNAQINEQDKQNVTAVLDIDMQRSDEPAIRAAFDAAGEVLSRQITRAGESENVTDSKVRYTVSLVPAKSLKSREVTTLGIEVEHVDETATLFAAQVAEVNGRQIDAKFTREANGKSVAKLIFEVPLAAAAGLVERFKAAGTVRASQSVRDPQATEGKFATARIEATLANRESIIAADDGLWSQVRRGLSYSATVLLTSVTWVVFGLCVILPWAVIGYVLYRVIRRTVAPAVAKTPETVPSPPATT